MKSDPISKFIKQFFEGSTLLLLVFTLLIEPATARTPDDGGDQPITLSLKNVPIEQIIEHLRSQYGYSFVYKPQEVDVQRRVTVEVQQQPIDRILDIILAAQPVSYEVKNKIIHINRQQAVAENAETGRYVDGVVVDENGVPIVGAAVIVKGTSRGVSSGVNGDFRIGELPEKAVLSISALGYAAADIPVGSRTSLRIVLKEDAQTLDDVVIVGYGSQKKVNLTGAVESVSSDVFENRPVANVTQMLQGAVPNLNISLADGKPNRSADRKSVV